MRRLLELCFLVLFAIAAGACAGSPGSAVFVRANLVAKRFTLANGLDVILHPDPTFRSVAVSVRYDVGSRHDPPDATGLAHLVELFPTTKAWIGQPHPAVSSGLAPHSPRRGGPSLRPR